MKIEIINEEVKKLTADSGMVLSNGGEFDMYPVELYTDVNDTSWVEIVEPFKQQ